MTESKIVLTESAGPWPMAVSEDIINARDELIKLGHGVLVITQLLGYNTPVNMRISPNLYEALNQHIPNTTVSYRRFIEKNGIATIIRDDGIEDTMALISFENDTIQIIGIHGLQGSAKE